MEKKVSARAQYESRYLEFIESIENGTHPIFDGLKSEIKLPLGTVVDNIQQCLCELGMVRDNFFSFDIEMLALKAELKAFSVKEEGALSPEEVVERKKLEDLIKRIEKCKDRIERVVETLWSRGVGLISTEKFAQAFTEDVKNERPNATIKTEAKIDMGKPYFDSEDEAKQWMLAQGGNLSVEYAVKARDIDDYRKEVKHSADLTINDETNACRQVKDSLCLERYGSGHYVWTISNPGELLMSVNVSSLYDLKKEETVGDEYYDFRFRFGRKPFLPASAEYLIEAGKYEDTRETKYVDPTELD